MFGKKKSGAALVNKLVGDIQKTVKALDEAVADINEEANANQLDQEAEYARHTAAILELAEKERALNQAALNGVSLAAGLSNLVAPQGR